MNSPGFTALDADPLMLPDAAAYVEVFAIWIAPCPVPFWLVLNSPGENEPSGTACGALDCPPTVTTTMAEVAVPSPAGIWTLSCPGNAENIGAEIPLKVTLAPPRVVSSSPLVPKEENALFVPSSKVVPKMAAMVPGARGFVPKAKLALLTTLSGGTTGLDAASTTRTNPQRIEMRKKVVYI